VQTLPNFDLGPERLVGTEGGITAEVAPNLVVRATVFDNRVRNPVANLTVTQNGANVTLKRSNLGRTTIRGFQTDFEYHLNSTWRFSGGYLHGESKVAENPDNPSLVGRFLPQVPKNRGSLLASYMNPRVADVTLSVQAIGAQYDDDQNIRGVPGQTIIGLPAYTVVGLNVSRQVGKSVQLFFGAQNLMNATYYVGTLPTLVGSPRQVNGGLRLTFRGR